MLSFIAVVLGINTLLHGFLYFRLVVALGITSSTVLWWLRGVTVFLIISYVLARWVERSGFESLAIPMNWFASVWIGAMFELLWMTALLTLIQFILIITGIWSGFDPQTKSMLGYYSVIGVFFVTAVLCTYGVVRASMPARIVYAKVPVKNITPELRNLKISLAADFHIDMQIREKQVRRMVAQINAQSPDLVLIPGDLVDRNVNHILKEAEAFTELKAPLGVYVTTGNHEYYAGIQSSLEFCRRANFRMLMDDAVELPNGLVLAGIQDHTANQFRILRPSVQQVLSKADTAKPVIFLNHTPGTVETDQAVANGADLVVSGHTHRGQIWPFSYLSARAFKYHYGLYKINQGHIFTTGGIGFWGPPMRIFAPPEIVMISLVGADEPAAVEWH